MAQYQFPQSEPNFIESHSLELEAGRTRILECYGRTFVCVQAVAGFMMSFNNGKLFDCRNGVEWSLGVDERYNLLKFKSAIAQRLKVLTGNFFYHENVVTPVSSVAQTLIKPWTGSYTLADTDVKTPRIAAHETLSFPGTGADGSGLGYRKHIVVSNYDPVLTLALMDTSNVLLATIFPQQSNVFEYSGDLKLKNWNASQLYFSALEIFYAA